MPPPPWPSDLLPELARLAAARPAVILDDDPTGTQTLRDVPVLSAWDVDAIAGHLDGRVLFLSTNSRSLDEAAASAITGTAATDAMEASRRTGRAISIVSRSDSTLRGHFPAETMAVAAAIGRPDARVLLAPFFGEGGRLTVDDVHLLERDGHRQPVSDTEFARDAVFGYRSSNLHDWVAERYAASGRAAPPVIGLSLEQIRSVGPQAVERALRSLPAGGVAIANAEVDRDIEVTALGALRAEIAGLPLVARTAASYVRARAGRAPAPSLRADELGAGGVGLGVVGSHVETTTRQLDHLLAASDPSRLVPHELPLDPILAGGPASDRAIREAAEVVEGALATGRTGLISTERARREVGLDGGRRISNALVAVVEAVRTRPGWVIGKGGITSSDLASRALGMREARVAGQLLPGVPVWIGSEGSRWPGMPLVVFPGNVGDADALTRTVALLAGPRPEPHG
ncbi:MAG: four-carbon acid sugar kinase family protein [Candidatus Limnocylindria bacterium]